MATIPYVPNLIISQRIQYYDSIGGQGRFYMEGLQSFFRDEEKKYNGTETFADLLDMDSWELVDTQVSHKYLQ